MLSINQCDINNVPSSVVKLDKNIFYVDGFMVHQNKDGSRCVFDFQNPGRIYVSKAAKKAVAELPLFNWQKALLGIKIGTGVKCTSKTLFNFIETSPMDVYELDGAYHRRKVRDSKTIKTLPSITVETVALYGKLNNYFLYFHKSSFVDVIPSFEPRTLVTNHDLDFFNHKLCVYDIPFNETDFAYLWNFENNKEVYFNISKEVFEHVYKYVQTHFPNKAAVSSFSNVQKIDVFPKKLSTSTLSTYSNHFTRILYLIDMLKNLSFIQALDLPERFIFPTLSLSRESNNVDVLSCFFFGFFNDESGIVAVWDYLLRLMALDWTKYTSGLPQTISLDSYRRLMDTIRQCAINFTLYRCCRDTGLGEKMTGIFTNCSNESNIWNNFCLFYSDLIQEMKLHPVQFSYLDNESVTVSRKPFSINYVRSFYKDIKEKFDKTVAVMIENVYGLQDVASTMKIIAASPVSRPIDSSSNNVESILEIFKSDLPSILPSNFVRNVDYSHLLKMIDNLSIFTAWMIYFSAGGPYRFQEITMFRVAGTGRNVYYNAVKQCIELGSTYSKSRNLNYIIKRCDKLTSRYILYYILVVKTIQIKIFDITRRFVGHGFANSFSSSVNLGTEFNRISGEEMTPSEYSKFICHTFLFIDSFEDRTMSYEKFAKYYGKMPVEVSSGARLNFKEMRHGIIALQRLVIRNSHEKSLLDAVERIAGHSVSTGRAVYAVNDSDRCLSSIDNEKYLLVSEEWQKAIGFVYIDQLDVPDIEPTETHLVDGRNFDIRCRPCDLFKAGALIYGEGFSFRGSQQQICSDIVWSSTAIFPIHALPGYGKTCLFQIPLVTIKKCSETKFVSFVFVPYVVLLSNCVLRLRSGNLLNVGLVKDLINGSYIPDSCELCDVYVGTFNDMANKRFQDIFNNWNSHGGNSKIGLVVIDEFHTIEGDWNYREDTFVHIGNMNFNMATKLMLLSGTMGENGFSKCFEKIGMNVSLSKNILEDGKTFVYDLVNDIPLKNIIKHFELLKQPDECFKRAKSIIDAFLKVNLTSKAIVIFGEVDAATNFAEIYSHSLLVFGNIESAEKINALKSFVSDPRKRLFIGTCLVGEGIDISSVNLVLLVDYYPPIFKYIQAAGRIRTDGVCWSLWCPQRSNVDKDIMNGCITEKIGIFYNIPVEGHCGCCGNWDSVSQKSRFFFATLKRFLFTKRRASNGSQEMSKKFNSNIQKNTKSPTPSTSVSRPISISQFFKTNNMYSRKAVTTTIEELECPSTTNDVDLFSTSTSFSLPNNQEALYLHTTGASDPLASSTSSPSLNNTNCSKDLTLDNNFSSSSTNPSISTAAFSTTPTEIDVFNNNIISEPQHTQGTRDISIVHGFDSNISLPPSSNTLKTHSSPYNIPDRNFNSFSSNGTNAFSTDANISSLTVKTRTISTALSTVSNLLNKPANTHEHSTPIKHTFKSSKSIIHSAFAQHLSIFDYLELPAHFIRFLKPWYIGGSYFNYSLSPYSNRCGGCGGDANLSCICWKGKARSVINFGIQILVLCEHVLTEAEYDTIKNMCKSRGIISVMIYFIQKRDYFKRKVLSSKAVTNYCNAMKFYSDNFKKPDFSSVFQLKHPCCLAGSIDDVIKAYNYIWFNLKYKKFDIMVYFATLKLVPGEYFWNNYSSTKEFYLHMKKNFKHVADCSFLSEYNNNDDYIFSVINQKVSPNFFYYKEDKDVSIRRNNHAGQRIPIFTIGLRLYFYMLFFLFNNDSYMRLFYKVFPNIPRVKFFYQWVYLQRAPVFYTRYSSFSLYFYHGIILKKLSTIE